MLNLAIFAGGDSEEALVSMKSAAFVLSETDTSRYQPYLVQIEGNQWNVLFENSCLPVNRSDFSFDLHGQKIGFDLALIMIHGTPGEDGKLQGWLDIMKIPYPGCGVLCSALTFNKYACKQALRPLNISLAKGIMLRSHETPDYDAILQTTGLPCFVKPNNGGSSFGVSKVNQKEQLGEAIEKAFGVDREILVEEYISGTEITCGLTEVDGEMIVLPITEVVSKNEFFDYQAKYEDMSEEITPARISPDLRKACEETSVRVYQTLGCKGIVRIDYIIHDNRLYLLEVNTIPGMTEKSFIPQQLRAQGIPVKTMLRQLLDNCLNR